MAGTASTVNKHLFKKKFLANFEYINFQKQPLKMHSTKIKLKSFNFSISVIKAIAFNFEIKFLPVKPKLCDPWFDK